MGTVFKEPHPVTDSAKDLLPALVKLLKDTYTEQSQEVLSI